MVYFIVEGQTDKALIKKLLLPKAEKTDFKFLGLKGISSVIKTLENLTDHELSPNKYFAIVDADSSFNERNEEMQRITSSNGVEFFIFPNHQDNGDLETLLLSNIDDENKIIKCFEKYKECVDTDIDNKAKLYAYTTLEHSQRPEEYIEGLSISSDFDILKQKLQTLFEGIE